jgi:branched-chain amino acid transport system permease protein
VRDLIQVVVTGATLGSVLALVAIGYNLVFSATRIVNFALGPMLIVAGFTTFVLQADPKDQRVSRVPWDWLALDLPLPVAILAAMVLTTAVGALVHLVAIKPLGRFDPANNIGWILTTAGVGLALTNIIVVAVGSESRPLPSVISSVFGWRGSLVGPGGGVPVSPNDLVLVVAAIGIVVLVEVLQVRTAIGRAFRAVSQDRQAASLMGINPDGMVLLAFAMAGLLAAVAVMLIVPRQGNGLVAFVPIQLLGIQAFIAAVLGGLGSTRGAVVGGYAIGLVSALVTTVWRADYEPLIVFAMFLAILVVRPNGVLGRPIVEKV